MTYFNLIFDPFLLLAFVIIAVTHVYNKFLVLKGYDYNQFYQIPGPRGLPIVGNVLDLLGPMQELCVRVMNTFGPRPMTKFEVMGRPFVVLTRAPGFEAVLKNPQNIDRGQEGQFLSELTGKGLFSLQRKAWKPKRKTMATAFNLKMLQDYVLCMNEHSLVFTAKLAETAGREFDIFPHIRRCTLNTITHAACGRQRNTQPSSDQAYGEALNKAMELSFFRMRNPLLWSNWTWKLSQSGQRFRKLINTTQGFILSIIKERREAENCGPGENDERDRLSFLDHLLDMMNGTDCPASDASIHDDMNTFVIGGFDTVATACGMTLFLLASHPDIQQKVRDEVDIILGKNLNGFITIDDLDRMTYLECCFKEALRLYPIVPASTRELFQATEIYGIEVPAKTSIVLPYFMLHRDPTIFPDPETFNPERFADPEKNKQRHPFAYLPFAGGPRNCIGYRYSQINVKLMVAMVLSKFELTSSMSPEEMTKSLQPHLTLKPTKGVPMTIKIRK